MALTTVNPSPACGMCRSDSSTSNFSVAMRASASLTLATATTSNPSRSSVTCNMLRTASLSSASKILGIHPTAFSSTMFNGIGSFSICLLKIEQGLSSWYMAEIFRKPLGCGPSYFLPHQATHGFLELGIHLIRDDHYI